MRLLRKWLFVFTLLPAFATHAQSPVLQKIDPPNWFAALPKPMLLIQGEGLERAQFRLSDPALKVERTVISANGHWAQLWLSASPAKPETVTLEARTPAGRTSAPYTFAPRRIGRADSAGPQASQAPAGLSSADVLYLIMPDRFADGDAGNDALASSPPADRSAPRRYHGGDLEGVTQHLDYIQQLGATAIWLTPVVENDPQASDYHGYGATDLYAVEPRLGTLADYKRLAEEMHRRHLKLVFDDVPNHVGPHHPWVTDPPTSDWFHGSMAHHLDNRFKFSPVTDPHAPVHAAQDALDGWFANVLADLNQANPAVRQYLTENMIWWIEEVGIDALRIDTFPYVQRDFWQAYLGTLTALYPRLTAIGEVDSPDPTVNAFFAGGRTLLGVDTHLSTSFDYPLWHTLIDVLVKGKPMSQLEETLRQDWLYPHPETLVPFLSNHDQVRFLSQPGVTAARLRLGLGLLLTVRGMPELYAGDEILMQGSGDPDNRRDFPGGFPGYAQDAFTPKGRTPEQAAMHDWVVALGALRASSATLRTGAMQTVLAGDSTFAYLRMPQPDRPGCTRPASMQRASMQPGAMLIAFNRGDQAQDLVLPTKGTALEGCRTATLRLGDDRTRTAQQVGTESLTLHLPANGFAIYALQ